MRGILVKFRLLPARDLVPRIFRPTRTHALLVINYKHFFNYEAAVAVIIATGSGPTVKANVVHLMRKRTWNSRVGRVRFPLNRGWLSDSALGVVG